MSDISNQQIENAQPVILIGRGGGGTRLLSQMVTSFGYFFGSDINVSYDSVEWVGPIYGLAIENLNKGVEAGSPRDEHWRDKMQSHAAKILTGGDKTPSDQWGWKLPETTLIVPHIMRYLPNARFVHLTRHPVSSCCRRTHMTSRLNNAMGAAALPAAYTYMRRAHDLMENDPIHIHNAVSWAHQTAIACEALSALEAKGQAMTIKYEDLCASPEASNNELCEFLGLNPNDHQSDLGIDPARLNNKDHVKDEAAAVWDICGETAAKLGYQW